MVGWFAGMREYAMPAPPWCLYGWGVCQLAGGALVGGFRGWGSAFLRRPEPHPAAPVKDLALNRLSPLLVTAPTTQLTPLPTSVVAYGAARSNANSIATAPEQRVCRGMGRRRTRRSQ